MEKDMQIYEMPAWGAGAPWQRTMVEDKVLRRDEPCYVTYSGETFYIGDEGKPAETKPRRSIFSRIFRRKAGERKKISAWKKSIA